MIEQLKKILRRSKADATSISCYSTKRTVTKFGKGRIYQNLEDNLTTAYIKVAVGNKVGVASTDCLMKDHLEHALKKALEIAKLSHDNEPLSKFPHGAKGKKSQGTQTFFEDTASLKFEERFNIIKRAVSKADKKGVEATGTLITGIEELGVVNSSGVEEHSASTISSVKLVTTKGASSGYASGVSREIGKLGFDAISDKAIEKCLLNKNPKDIPLGRYDVILEPQAVCEILDWLSYIAFGAKSLFERTSFLSGRIGDKVMGENVTIYDDGLDPEGLIQTFDFEGTRKKKTFFIQNGTAIGACYDSHYGHIYKTPSTGHGLTPDGTEGPLPMNMIMQNGSATYEDMLHALHKGILVTRFHYVNGFLDTQQALMTGLTRDGTFLIQNGRIKHALKNLRFTESILKAFSQIDMISKCRELTGDPAQGGGASLVPALLIRGFNFTGITSLRRRAQRGGSNL